MKKIYLSGPMTGLPNFNYPKFNEEAAWLRARGYYVYNPAEYDAPTDKFPIREAFEEYTAFICKEATDVFMLPGWEKSLGARAEHALAVVLGLEISYSW